MKKQKNILFIMTDQHRFDALSCMGHKLLKTPNIDRIADEGIRFTNTYTPCPVCAPARASVFSGQTPQHCGVVGNWQPFNGKEILLSEHLQNSGYQTGVVGKLHFVPQLKRWGFESKQLHDAPYSIYDNDDKYSDYIKWIREELGDKKADDIVKVYDEDENAFNENIEQFILGRDPVPEKYHMTTWTADKSIDFLKNRDKSRPFFLHTSFFGPHQPWEMPEPWKGIYNPDDIELPEDFDFEEDASRPIFNAAFLKQSKEYKSTLSRDDYKRIIARYYESIAMIDHAIGRIFETMNDEGIWEDTMIVFTSDHGDHNGQFGLWFKCSMYEGSAKVPLLIKQAGKRKVNKDCTDNLNTLDLYGTILDLAGNKDWNIPEVDSKSFIDKIDPKIEASVEDDGVVFSNLWGLQSMLREGDYKLIRLKNNDETLLYELYDMRMNDERINLFGNSDYKSISEKMVKKIEKLNEEN